MFLSLLADKNFHFFASWLWGCRITTPFIEYQWCPHIVLYETDETYDMSFAWCVNDTHMMCGRDCQIWGVGVHKKITCCCHVGHVRPKTAPIIVRIIYTHLHIHKLRHTPRTSHNNWSHVSHPHIIHLAVVPKGSTPRHVTVYHYWMIDNYRDDIRFCNIKIYIYVIDLKSSSNK